MDWNLGSICNAIQEAAGDVAEITGVANSLTGGNIPILSMGNRILKLISNDPEETRGFLKDLTPEELEDIAHACVAELADRGRGV